MANQTRQLAELLQGEGASVEWARTNSPYRPQFVAGWWGARALFRLVPYLVALWRLAGRVDLFHVMANSGWSWHLYAAPAIWAARLRRVPVIVNYRGGEAAQFLAKSQSLVRWSMRRANCVVVPSGFLERVFANHGITAQVVPNVVNLDLFHPNEAPRARAAHIVVARNLELLYDNESALRAFKRVLDRIPAATLTIAGRGAEESRLRSLAQELGLTEKVRFTGAIDREAMARLYRDADVSLNPSRADNMPNSLLESMASGVPVVSTNVGGVPFMVQHGVTALLVDAGDVPAMADAIVQLLEDPALWQRFSQAGLDQVRRYTWPQVAPQLEAIYCRAMHRA